MQFKRSKYLVLTINYLIPIFLIVLSIAAYFVVFHTQLFSLEEISCRLDYQPCDNPVILAELERYLGSNLLSFDPTELHDRLLSGDFTIREAEFAKALPHTLTLTLLSTYPTVAIQQLDHREEWVTLDQRLRIIAVRTVSPNVPVLSVETLPAFQLGGKLSDPVINSSLEAVLVIARELPSVELVSLDSDSSLELRLPGNKTAMISSAKELLPQLRTLQSLLLDQETITSSSVIDLRYAQPVLR